MYCCLSTSSPDRALLVACACSPHVRAVGASAAIFDVSGCGRTIGPPEVILREIVALAGDGEARAAVAPTVTAAWLIAAARPGTAVSARDAQAALLAEIPIGWLGTIAELDGSTVRRFEGSKVRGLEGSGVRAGEVRELLAIFERWGIRTLGDLARLPRRDIQSRMGPAGVRLHQAAIGEDARPFVPMDEALVFRDRQELEWPIDGIEPLAFVLARACERLAAALVRADRGAVTVRTRLQLVTREAHERALHLPAAVADARVLRTLILLDLESHPPPAAIDIVTIDLDVSPGPIVQGSLIAPALPAPEALATLLARLTALAGVTRVGRPAVLDTYDARAVGLEPFAARADRRQEGGMDRADAGGQTAPAGRDLSGALRRLRLPVAARVETERLRPLRVLPSARGWAGGAVTASAGPWRSSGRWWAPNRGAWDRDEWDVEIASGIVYRLARDRATGRWEIEGILD